KCIRNDRVDTDTVHNGKHSRWGWVNDVTESSQLRRTPWNSFRVPPLPDLAIWVALALTILAVYWQVRHFDFINFDDDVYVYRNPSIQSGLHAESVREAFTS